LAESFFYLFICWSKTLLAAAKIDAILATCFFILYFDLSFFIKSLRTLLSAAFIIDHQILKDYFFSFHLVVLIV
jgi:hypothetical protein